MAGDDPDNGVDATFNFAKCPPEMIGGILPSRPKAPPVVEAVEEPEPTRGERAGQWICDCMVAGLAYLALSLPWLIGIGFVLMLLQTLGLVVGAFQLVWKWIFG